MKWAVKTQTPEERLAEIDTVIMNTSQEGCNLLRKGAPLSEVDSVTEFLRSLYRRRDVILNELRKKGISEKQAYEQLNGKGGAQHYELDRYIVQEQMQS